VRRLLVSVLSFWTFPPFLPFLPFLPFPEFLSFPTFRAILTPSRFICRRAHVRCG